MKQLQIKTNLILFICLAITYSLNAQKQIKYEKEYVNEIPVKNITSIQFIDSLSGKTDTINIYKVNPYNYLAGKVIKKNDQGQNVYSVTSEQVNEIIPSLSRLIYRNDRRILDTTIKEFEATSFFITNEISENYIAIGYQLIVKNNDEYWGTIGTVLIFDKNADIVYRNNNIDVGINNISVSKNGKYFTITYGISGENDSLIPDGYRIYDIKNNRIILDKRYPGIGCPFSVNDLLINGGLAEGTTRVYNYFVFNSEKNTLYSKAYNPDELQYLKEITNEGFVFIDANNVKRIDSLEKTFNNEELK
jgi:hypothetical protein